MVQLTQRRTEFLLYGVLLVLPAAVLAGVHWHQLVVDHRAMLADVPRAAEDAARRLRENIVDRVEALLASENARPYYEYRDTYFPEGTIGTELAFLPSPLVRGPVPDGILAWFSYDFRDGADAQVDLFHGGREGSEEWEADRDALRANAQQLVGHDWQDGFLRRIARINGLRTFDMPLTVAAINQSPERDLDCLRSDLPALLNLAEERVTVHVFAFHLRFYVDETGYPRILATRRVLISPNPKMKEMPVCFETLGYGTTLVQGFFIDPIWLFNELPLSLKDQVLDPSCTFYPPGTWTGGDDPTEVSVPINLIRGLDIETYSDDQKDFGEMRVAITSNELEHRFRAQTLRFLGVSGMLLLSLSTGIFLLWRTVRKDLDQARRTENFVSAVTHELRTPISAIRLYGEMLRDGWTTAAEKRSDYYERIVREVDRLEMTVERVLEKGHITSTDIRPIVGDLNEEVDAVALDLARRGGSADDLAFDLAPDLPVVWLHREGVRSILTNLVENARKYAPVGLNGNATEPIRIRTRRLKKDVVLEVADRGPGIPPAERARIFDAFYRIGNEATRSTQGTGLGLHLVSLQAKTMGGKAAVLEREGGGTIFRVTFKPVRESG